MTEILYRTGQIASEAGRTVHGLAVPYGEVAEVRDGYGPAYRETFQRGAFERTIRERGEKVRLWIVHDTSKRLPIGRATELTETDAGLRVAFYLPPGNRDADDALSLVRAGVVDAFSIGFAPVRHIERNGVVVRTEVSLREVSLVGMPAYSGAVVAGVRSSGELLTKIYSSDAIDRLIKLGFEL